MVVMTIVSCQKFDDSEIWDKLNNHEARLAYLEEVCKSMNSSIVSLQAIVTALETNDYVISASPLVTGDGYTLLFRSGKSVVIYNGKDGQDGSNGTDGVTPVIGVRQDADGIYYWTVNGEWLYVDGKKVKASATDGKNGADGADGITPQLQIIDGYWAVSYDGGVTWDQLGKASYKDECVSSIFSEIEFDGSLLCFRLQDGTEITVPVKQSVQLTLGSNELSCMPNMTCKVPYTISGADEDVVITTISEGGYTMHVNKIGATSGEIVIQTSDKSTSGKVLVILSGISQTIVRTINVNVAELTFTCSVCSATYAEIAVVLGKEFKYGFCLPLKMYKMNDHLLAAQDYIGGTAEDREELLNYIFQYGWGVSNPSYYNRETLEYEYYRMEDKLEFYPLDPNTEYVIAYCGKTTDGEKTELCFSKPFHTKELYWSYNNVSDLELTVSDLTDYTFKMEFTYNPVKTALVKWVAVLPDTDYFPGKDASQDSLRYFIEAYCEYHLNIWPRLETGRDTWQWPSSNYNVKGLSIVYCSEDIYGRMSEIKVLSL